MQIEICVSMFLLMRNYDIDSKICDKFSNKTVIIRDIMLFEQKIMLKFNLKFIVKLVFDIYDLIVI